MRLIAGRLRTVAALLLYWISDGGILAFSASPLPAPTVDLAKELDPSYIEHVNEWVSLSLRLCTSAGCRLHCSAERGRINHGNVKVKDNNKKTAVPTPSPRVRPSVTEIRASSSHSRRKNAAEDPISTRVSENGTLLTGAARHHRLYTYAFRQAHKYREELPRKEL